MAILGFIGIGNMGYAMLKGALSIYSPDDIVITDVNEGRKETVRQETGVRCVESNAECANSAKYIILAIKPQYYDKVIKNIENVIKADQVLISIAPGFTIEDLQKKLGVDKRIVRAMPNTPAMVGEGMTGLCFDEAKFSFDEKQDIFEFFESFGKAQMVEERCMNAVVCASGSSPAYVYMFIEALADSAVKYGMARDAAYQFAAQAVLGSAKMVLESGEHPGKLKDMVCSPGGTTIAAVAALEEYGFRNAVLKAADACFQKSESIK